MAICDACGKATASAKVQLRNRSFKSCAACLPLYQVGVSAVAPGVAGKLCELCVLKKASKKVHLLDGAVKKICVDCLPPTTPSPPLSHAQSAPVLSTNRTSSTSSSMCVNCSERVAANAVTSPSTGEIFRVCTLCTPLMSKKLKEAALLTAANGRTTMYLPPTASPASSSSPSTSTSKPAVSRGATDDSKLAPAKHARPADRAQSQAQLRSQTLTSKSGAAAEAPARQVAPAAAAMAMANKAQAALLPAKASKKSSKELKKNDDRRKTTIGVGLVSSADDVRAGSKFAQQFGIKATAAEPATPDVALSTPTVVLNAGVSLRPKCAECKTQDASTKVEFDGHQRLVCAKCAQRFTALQKALSFDSDKAESPPARIMPRLMPQSSSSPSVNRRASTPEPKSATLERRPQASPPPASLRPAAPLPQQAVSAAAQADRGYGVAPPAATQTDRGYGVAPPMSQTRAPAALPERRQSQPQPSTQPRQQAPAPQLKLSMPVIESVPILEKRVETTTSAAALDEDGNQYHYAPALESVVAFGGELDDSGSEDLGYVPLAARPLVVQTSALSDSDDDEPPPPPPPASSESDYGLPPPEAVEHRVRLATMDSIVNMEPLSDSE